MHSPSPVWHPDFRDIACQNGELEGSTHGEFGRKANWNIYATSINKWLIDLSNRNQISEIANLLSPNNAATLLTWATSGNLFAAMNEALSNVQITSDDIAETLAEAGLLPMYGMPTRLRELYSGFTWNNNSLTSEVSSVSRDIEMAVTSFAPKAQVTKDKRVITSIGSTFSMHGISSHGLPQLQTFTDVMPAVPHGWQISLLLTCRKQRKPCSFTKKQCEC